MQCPQLIKRTRILKYQTNNRPSLRGITDQYRTYLNSIPDYMRGLTDQYQTDQAIYFCTIYNQAWRERLLEMTASELLTRKTEGKSVAVRAELTWQPCARDNLALTVEDPTTIALSVQGMEPASMTTGIGWQLLLVLKALDIAGLQVYNLGNRTKTRPGPAQTFNNRLKPDHNSSKSPVPDQSPVNRTYLGALHIQLVGMESC